MITIIGAGNGGLAMASYLTEKGNEVLLWNRSIDKLQRISRNNNKIIVNNHIKNEKKNVRVGHISFNLKEAVVNSKIIMIITPGNAHKSIGQRIAEYLNDNQIIILMPGRTFGCIEFLKTVKRNKKINPICIETQSILHTCRFENDILDIYAIKPKLEYSSLQILKNSKKDRINKLSQSLCYNSNYLSVSLNNIGAMLHPIPTVLNVSRIENNEKFNYYYEGITPRIANFIEKIDRERENICNEVGAQFMSVVSWLNREYMCCEKNLYNSIKKVEAYKNILGPKTIKHRYIYDDIITGLVPIYYLGDKMGLKLDNMRIFLEFASSFLDYDFIKYGRKYSLEDIDKVIMQTRG